MGTAAIYKRTYEFQLKYYVTHCANGKFKTLIKTVGFALYQFAKAVRNRRNGGR